MRRRKNNYSEASLIERALPPVGKLVAWVDAYFLVFWGKILSILDRFVDRAAVSGGMFVAAIFFGWVFVLKVVSSRPELGYTQVETLKVGVALTLAIGILRFLCAHTTRALGKLSSRSSQKGIEFIQPFRPAATAMLVAIGIYGASKVGVYHQGVWYLDGYFYLLLTSLSCILGIYAHSANIYLENAVQLKVENLIKSEEIAGVSFTR